MGLGEFVDLGLLCVIDKAMSKIKSGALSAEIYLKIDKNWLMEDFRGKINSAQI